MHLLTSVCKNIIKYAQVTFLGAWKVKTDCMIMQTIYLYKYAMYKTRIIKNLKFKDRSCTATKSKETRILAQENTGMR